MTVTLAICPLYAGYCGICIADGLTVLYAQSHEVGTLSPSDATPGRTMTRTVEHGHVFSIVDLVRSLVGTYGATEVLIERAANPRPRDVSAGGGVTAHRAQWIADAIEGAMAADGTPHRLIPATWRERMSVGRIAHAVSEAYGETWPATGGYAVVRSAGALILHAAGVKLPPAPKTSKHKEVTDAPFRAPAVGESTDLPPIGGETDTQPGRGGPFTPPAPTYNGRPDIIAGVDPGSGWVGHVIAEGTAAPLRTLLAQTLPIGERLPLAKPKTFQRADGTEVTVTHRHQVLPSHIVSVADLMAAEWARLNVGVVVIESIEHGWVDASKPGAAHERVKQLIITGKVEQEIASRARAMGLRVETVLNTTWAGKIAPRKVKDGPGVDARVRAAVLAGLSDWTGDEHAADAAGVCLWYVTPDAEAVGKVRVPGTRGLLKPGGDWRARGNAKRGTKTKRVVLGCTCVDRVGNGRGGGRHPKGCPVAVAAKARRTAKLGKGEVRV